VERVIKSTAAADGKATVIGIEQDPEQAGVFEAAYYAKALAGQSFRIVRPTGDKVTRAGPVSSQAAVGNLKVLRATWTERLLQELEQFPEGNHDDQVDALSGAFALASSWCVDGRIYTCRQRARRRLRQQRRPPAIGSALAKSRKTARARRGEDRLGPDRGDRSSARAAAACGAPAATSSN
jgi:predicted phage terminase large subunit-like protein